MKYWAKHSTVWDGSKPVYFSSVVMSDKTQQMNKCALKSVYSCAGVLSIPSGKIP